jgi:NAD+ diphosphatase
MIQDIFPHRFDNHYLAGKSIEDTDYILHFEKNTLLMKLCGEELELPRKQDFTEVLDWSGVTFLFTIDEISCFILWDKPAFDESAFGYREISFFRTIKQKETGFISVVGYHLQTWYSEHRFCGKCGTKTYHKADERALVCPACNTHFFPKISPAIIVAIICNDKILLARNANFTGGWFSLIAGYADVGETLEETVVREVKEEVGIDVKNIRYYTSQPWPLSGSMMIGFVAEADDTQPVIIDNKEITLAQWFDRGNLPAYPSAASIAGEIIGKFEKGEL